MVQGLQSHTYSQGKIIDKKNNFEAHFFRPVISLCVADLQQRKQSVQDAGVDTET